ncbi:hypothetical protein HY949_00895 [Candidatus Gottesmanbacteria bacterium]|nr:hypothetical protein [Candidatus Gottesmanbacteria bacterium]
MHSFIITGGSAQERMEQIAKLLKDRSISSHDVITIAPDPSSIGVDSMRGIGTRLSLSPIQSAGHAVIVHDAHTMTPEAQNAFLKTLEEPPGEAALYLETGEPDALLPTIVSRCQTIRLTANSDRVQPCQEDMDTVSQSLKKINQILGLSVGERLKMIDATIKTRDDALAFVDQSIRSLESLLHMTGSRPVTPSLAINLSLSKTSKLLRAFLTARTHIMSNITPKLALDAVFLP